MSKVAANSWALVVKGWYSLEGWKRIGLGVVTILTVIFEENLGLDLEPEQILGLITIIATLLVGDSIRAVGRKHA